MLEGGLFPLNNLAYFPAHFKSYLATKCSSLSAPPAPPITIENEPVDTAGGPIRFTICWSMLYALARECGITFLRSEIYNVKQSGITFWP